MHMRMCMCRVGYAHIYTRTCRSTLASFSKQCPCSLPYVRICMCMCICMGRLLDLGGARMRRLEPDLGQEICARASLELALQMSHHAEQPARYPP